MFGEGQGPVESDTKEGGGGFVLEHLTINLNCGRPVGLFCVRGEKTDLTLIGVECELPLSAPCGDSVY